MIGYGNSMFLATHGILARPTGGISDPDAQAFITAAAITDPTQQAAINTLVVDLKGYNIWTKMKALYPFVGGTSSTHKFNLKDPRDLDAAFRIFWNGGVTHGANGVQFGGVNGYGDTFLTPSTSLTTSSAHFSKYNRTNDLIGNKIDGVTKFDGTSFFQQNYSAGNSIIGEIGSLISYTQTDTRGLFTATRTATNVSKVFKNSTQQGSTNTTTITNIPISTIYIGARNSGNNVGEFYNSYQCAFASIGDGLTDTEAANLYTAVQAFQTTLGRSIGTQTVSDADAQAFVTAANIQDQVEANAINNLVIGMKADGLWTKMKAVYPFVGGTNAQHTWNLRNTAQFQISWAGGVTSSNLGVQFNNLNSYGITGLIPSSALTLNSTHMSFYSRTTGNVGIDDFGAYNGVNQAMRVIIKDGGTSNHILDMNSTSQRVTGTVADSTGFFLCNRETSTALRSLRNNVSLGSNTNTNTGTLPSVAMYLGGLNNAGSFANPSGRQCAFASVGDGLTATDQTNLYTRVTTFQTALNRNV